MLPTLHNLFHPLGEYTHLHTVAVDDVQELHDGKGKTGAEWQVTQGLPTCMQHIKKRGCDKSALSQHPSVRSNALLQVRISRTHPMERQERQGRGNSS
jgi:hypothetical protein